MKIKRWIMVPLAALLLLSGCGSRGQVMDRPGMVNSYQQISQDEAKEMMLRDDGHIVVDVRRQDEYDAGHIPGAILIPNEDIDTTPPKELPDLNQIILIYCRSGNRSKQASQKLFDMGYTNVYEFGGINTWTGEIVTEEPTNQELWSAAEMPVSIRYDRMWEYSDYSEITDPEEIEEIVAAVRALKVKGPTDVCVDDYTDILTCTFADGTITCLEFEDQNWVTEANERIEVEGLARLRSLLDDILEKQAEAEANPERQDGERFESVIMVEGMEETVQYEHIRNEKLGFEMDYDYELFERRSEADRECFVSIYDDPDHPEDYLEVKYSPEDAEATAAAISEVLAKEYELSRDDAFPLDRAGGCIRIDASEVKGGGYMPEYLQMVYIISADDGCRVATAHYYIVGSEGFGRRFAYMMQSFMPIDPSKKPGGGETMLTRRNVSEDLLLIVDFQNVYLPGYDWACPSMPEAMKNTVKILDAAPALDYVMTKYIAPAEPIGRWAQYNEAYKEINENDFLCEFSDEIAPYAVGARSVVEKSTYSSMDSGAVLEAMNGKKAIVLVGVTAECCILATMMDAIDQGYEVVYLYDCIAGQTAELEAQVRGIAEIFTPVHTTIMSSDEYLSSIQR